MIKILLVDDHILFREGLSSLLAGQPDLQVVGAAKTVKEAISQARELKPDLILMDFNMPDGSGLEATQAILEEDPDAKIIFLTVHEEDERLFAAIRSGAKGYLLKNIPLGKLIKFLRGVFHGEAAITPDLVSRVLEEFAQAKPQRVAPDGIINSLTARELEVLLVLETGATNQEIATHLVISERTVKNHVSHILDKLNIKNRYEAAILARRHGLTGN